MRYRLLNEYDGYDDDDLIQLAFCNIPLSP